MLDQITPVILAYNEAANIRRTMDQLRWARDIVVVDSFSDDATVEIVADFPQARVFQRHFDCFENQWNYGLMETSIMSDWVLALDADYVLSPEVMEEISRLKPFPPVNGYRVTFTYCVHGRPLRGSAYPPVTVLFRRARAKYRQDGHAYRVVVEGEIESLRSPVFHDDRKPLSRWLRSQDLYMQQELRKLAHSTDSAMPLTDRLRKARLLFPFAIFFYCLFVKGAIRDGWAGIHYAFERMLAETLLSLYLIEENLSRNNKTRKL